MNFGYFNAVEQEKELDKQEIQKEERHIRRMQFALQVILTGAVVGSFWIALHTYFKHKKKR